MKGTAYSSLDFGLDTFQVFGSADETMDIHGHPTQPSTSGLLATNILGPEFTPFYGVGLHYVHTCLFSRHI